MKIAGPQRAVFSLVITILTVLVLIAVVFPVFWIITTAIRPFPTISVPKFELIPKNATLEGFRWVLFESSFFLWLKNSLIVSAITVTLTLFLTILGAYSFSRFRFWGKESFLYGYFIASQFVGAFGITALIALYAFLARLGVINSLIILALIYTSGGIPFNTWLLKTYFDTLPKDFDEAALMDGASFLKVIYYVFLPIARPALAVVALFSFMGSWSEFILAQTLLGPENYTLPVGLWGLVGRWETPWNHFAAMAILFALPIVVFFIIAQRYLVAGLAQGGIKG